MVIFLGFLGEIVLRIYGDVGFERLMSYVLVF